MTDKNDDLRHSSPDAGGEQAPTQTRRLPTRRFLTQETLLRVALLEMEQRAEAFEILAR